jgi:hypothetical protein
VAVEDQIIACTPEIRGLKHGKLGAGLGSRKVRDWTPDS